MLMPACRLWDLSIPECLDGRKLVYARVETSVVKTASVSENVGGFLKHW